MGAETWKSVILGVNYSKLFILQSTDSVIFFTQFKKLDRSFVKLDPDPHWEKQPDPENRMQIHRKVLIQI